MNRGLAFRRDCTECGHSFLAADRKARFCPRCVSRVAARNNLAQKPRKITKPARVTPPESVPPAHPQAMTDELRAQVRREFELYKEEKEMPRRKVHAQIGRKLKIPKLWVAQALGSTREAPVLTKAQEERIIARFQEFVENMERPAKGRRKTIAAEMGLPCSSVMLVLRKWSKGDLRLQEIGREKRFLLEKVYFRCLDEGWPLSRTIEQMMEETGFNRWQVLRFLDLLHEGEERLKKIPDAGEEEKKKILEGYFEYLAGAAPPAALLHTLLAERAGVTYLQVHKALLAYRIERLRKAREKILNPNF